MSGRVKSSDLETREARKKLKVRGKPYYRAISDDAHLGYRKGKRERVWVVRRYIGNKQYRVESIGDADDTEGDGLSYWQAVEKAGGRAAELAAPKQTGPYKVSDAIRDYLVTLEGRPSYNDAKCNLTLHALPSLGSKPVSKLTPAMLRSWHLALTKAPKKTRSSIGREVDLTDPEIVRQRKVTANNILGQLKAALNHAFDEDKVKDDTAWRKAKPFAKVKRSRAAYLQLAECKRLLNACEPDFRELVRAALETGARYGELGRLKVGDFNRDSGTVTIHISKSGDPRHIELTEDGQAFFDDLVAGRKADEPMLRRKWKPSDQLRPMKAACVRAKIKPVGFHQLRHTWASLAVMNGMPIAVVAHNLGHVDTRMVEKHYGHLASSFIKQKVRKHAPRFGVKNRSNVKAI